MEPMIVGRQFAELVNLGMNALALIGARRAGHPIDEALLHHLLNDFVKQACVLLDGDEINVQGFCFPDDVHKRLRELTQMLARVDPALGFNPPSLDIASECLAFLQPNPSNG